MGSMVLALSSPACRNKPDLRATYGIFLMHSMPMRDCKNTQRVCHSTVHNTPATVALTAKSRYETHITGRTMWVAVSPRGKTSLSVKPVFDRR
jgi:hypothetical protein